MYPGRSRLPENTIKQSFKQVWESWPLGKRNVLRILFISLWFPLFRPFHDIFWLSRLPESWSECWRFILTSLFSNQRTLQNLAKFADDLRERKPNTQPGTLRKRPPRADRAQLPATRLFLRHRRPRVPEQQSQSSRLSLQHLPKSVLHQSLLL